MSGRQLGLIFGVLAVLVAILAVLRLGQGDREQKSAEGLDFSAFVTDETSLIRVYSPERGDSVRLEMNRGTWTANGYAADAERVGELVEDLTAAPTGRVVARSPDSHERMGVTEDVARRVVIGPVDTPNLVFLLGGSGTDGRYVRVPEADDVYSVRSESVTELDNPAVHWRDRRIAAIDTTAVTAIVVRGPDSALRVDRDVGGWSVDSQPANAGAVSGMLSKLADLQASGFPPDSLVWEFDFEAPDITVEVIGATGPGDPPLLTLLLVGVEGTSDYVAKTARGAYVYALSEFTLRPLLVDRDSLVGAP